MNLHETVTFLAQSNGKCCYPRREDEIEELLPYFEIVKKSPGKYEAKGYNFESHDNAPRMLLWEQYLNTQILPNVDPYVDISGFFNIELHDSYTYLDTDIDYTSTLCFSRFKDDFGPVLIPDPYMICNWGNALNHISDEMPWEKKINKVCFCGTTTGNRIPSLNERINLCLWGIDRRDFTDFHITKIAQMNPNDCFQIESFTKIYKNYISIDEQMKFRYHLNIDGNTCRYDVWPYLVNNVVLKYPSKDMLWYYPLVQDNLHYISVDKNTMQKKLEYISSNPKIAECIIYNAKELAKALFRPIIHQIYTISLFETIGGNK